MPKIEMPDPEFVGHAEKGAESAGVKSMREYGDYFKAYYEFMDDELEKRGLEFLGQGAECIVTSVDGEKKIVAAHIRYGAELEPRHAKQAFYLQRILETLFPHNFPHCYAAFGKKEEGSVPHASGTIRERVHKGTGIRGWYHRQRPKYPFSKVEEEVENMGVSVGIDFFKKNFIVGADGGEYYVDTLDNFEPKEWNIEKIMAYMDGRHYSEEAKYVVRNSIDRLMHLFSKAETS